MIWCMIGRSRYATAFGQELGRDRLIWCVTVQMRAEKEMADASSQDLSPVPVIETEARDASTATQPPQSTPSQSPARALEGTTEKQRTHRTRASGEREHRKKKSQPSKMEY